jgi:hypothetical protein
VSGPVLATLVVGVLVLAGIAAINLRASRIARRKIESGLATATGPTVLQLLDRIGDAPHVWFVGHDEGSTWSVGGIWSERDDAEAACTQPGDHYWPIPLDRDLGHELEPIVPVFPKGQLTEAMRAARSI